MSLVEYEKKRKFSSTPEPHGLNKAFDPKIKNRKFVIQKHEAKKLHYDFRLETKEGVLKSWAVPKGISLDPSVKRLAVLVEDHPLSYVDFEGVIPEKNYGAGTVIVWDTGTYSTQKDLMNQLEEGKILFTLYGTKVRGSFSLVKMRNDQSNKNQKQWLLIKLKDEFVSNEDLTKSEPQSVLTNRTNDQLESKFSEPKDLKKFIEENGNPKEFPTSVKPMLAMPVATSFDNKDWAFEVKWDGVRAILFQNKAKSIKEIQSRRGTKITQRYPEVLKAIDSTIKFHKSIVLDGELVVLGKDNRPNFQLHQKRINVDSPKAIGVSANEFPATYYVFDILYLDGRDLEALSFIERRKILSSLIPKNLGRIRVSDYIEENGIALFENVKKMGLEGIVAKYKSSRYLQDSRTPSWLKIKVTLTQDCVVIGYTRGEGNRKGFFGSVILAANYDGKLHFIGHCGSGFDLDQLEELYKMMQKITISKSCIENIPYVNREPVWVRPRLVIEVKFNGWTQDNIMRAPIFVRLRDDKSPNECGLETLKDTKQVITLAATKSQSVPSSFTNMTKIFWPATSDHREFKKSDLIEYYKKIAKYILTYIRDRPLSLSRYPDGILGNSFYHKNWSQSKPDYVKTVQVFSESKNGITNYIICDNSQTLLWLANLGCIEMHPWFSRVHDYNVFQDSSTDIKILNESKSGLEKPDFILFDLDPYIYSGNEKKGEEPEYNIVGFKAAIEIAFYLKDLLDGLGIKSYVKTSGKTGLHIFVPIKPIYSYEQTRAFAEIIGKVLLKRTPDKITTQWNTAKRKNKVFFDFNQNAKGKTIASVFSLRPTSSATVSMPIGWNKLENILPTDFTLETVPDILHKWTDPWKSIDKNKQDISKILERVSSLP